ncbi:MAG: Rieske 2Fe-2S domain-containing protein [Ilumatobacteraceae bacterium]
MTTSTVPALRDAWYPVALASEVTAAPVQVWLLDEPWVLWRAAGGEVLAFADRCPHRLAPLSAGCLLDSGEIQCGYHGWRFGASGACTLIPALGPGATVPPRARLHAAGAVAERAAIVWLAPEPPPVAPPVDEPLGAGFLTGILEPSVAEVDPGFMLDNFLDVAHFPFVHAATFGSAESGDVDGYELRDDERGFTAVTEHEFAHHEDPGVAAGVRPLVQRRRMTYTYRPPYVAELRLDYLDAGGTNIIVFGVQPMRGRTCRVYTTLLRDDLDATQLEHAVAFEQRVLDEDLAVQRNIRERMPTDRTVEVHTRADRLTIELRRVLADLVPSPAEQGA